ncbi:hypothetical protein HY468_03770, partial [Candidatus Roizmanbacteria bacterium]|nr:hypothetical protein [Candidatus Roizmanbacteria bacterium]
WFFAFFFILLTAGGFNRIYLNYAHDYYDYGGGAKISGKVDAIDFVYEDAKNVPFNVLVFMPPIYTYPYEYLFAWHGKNRYGYVPGNEKEGTFYLIMEPDPQKPWSYKGWQETVIKSGEVVWMKTLPSGTIVEKRIAPLTQD